MTARSVVQNGKPAPLPALKDGRVNFAAGFRRCRPTNAPRIGSLVIRDRSRDRTLILVTAFVEGDDSFQGRYVTPEGKTVEECQRTSFPLMRSTRPVYRARPSR